VNLDLGAALRVRVLGAVLTSLTWASGFGVAARIGSEVLAPRAPLDAAGVPVRGPGRRLGHECGNTAAASPRAPFSHGGFNRGRLIRRASRCGGIPGHEDPGRARRGLFNGLRGRHDHSGERADALTADPITRPRCLPFLTHRVGARGRPSGAYVFVGHP